MSAIFPQAFDAGGRLGIPPDGSLPGILAASAAQPMADFPQTAAEFAAARQALSTMLEQLNAAHPAAATAVKIRQTVLGGVPALLFEPPQPSGALLHIHGGGWYMGDAAMMRPQLARWSFESGLSIASLDYRLAPEHRYPAAQDDCERGALAWLENLPRPARRLPVLIAGESAGAHLAAVTAIRLRRHHGIRLDAAVLTYGMYDFANALPSRTVADAHTGLMDSRHCRFFAETYLTDAQQAFDPDVSPLRASRGQLADLPPALFIGAGLDPFCDDSVLMHSRWTLAGNRAWLALYEDAPHGFDLYGTAQSAHLDSLRLDFLKAAVAGGL
jgi:acetyl esterase/lipase